MKRIVLTLMSFMMLSCAPKPQQTVSQPGSELGFSLDFFSKVCGVTSAKENVSVSPYSAGVALSMLMEGAQGQTRVELDNALNGCRFTDADMTGNDSIVLVSSNSVWLDDDFAVRNSYVNHLSKQYDALATTLNFADPATVKAINEWCSEHTEGMIDGIIKELTPEMVMVLVNALYLDARWENPFKAGSTYEAVFNGAKGDSKVSFMSQKSFFNYAEYEGNQLVQLHTLGNAV